MALLKAKTVAVRRDMELSTEVTNAVRVTVKEQFGDAVITTVSVRPAEDSDGDPVLKIYVVFDSSNGNESLDDTKMAGFARHLIARLSELDFASFPHVNFVSKKDAAKLDLETA